VILGEREIESQWTLDKLAEQQHALDQHAIVAITDGSGTIVSVNEKFIQISGYTELELLGENHRLLNSGFHDETFFVEMYRTITRGDVWHGEICNKAKAGHLYWVDTTIVPFMDENNKPKSYIAIRTDITEKKRNLLQLKDALTALRVKQEQLEQEEKIAQHVFSNITASNNDDIDEVSTWCEPMGSFSGDMILSSLLPDGGLRIILCDFTGHGLPAALGAVPVSSIYTAITAKNLPLTVLMDELNNKLNTLLPTDIFCCIAGVDLNSARTHAHVWNAGLPDILLINHDGGIRQRFSSNHLPLGVMPYDQDEMYTYDIELVAGDYLYVYSDGLTEAENTDGEMLGQYRLEQLLKTVSDSKGRLEMIKDNVIKFVGEAVATDDVSLLEIKTLVIDDDNLLKS
jgi:PAS domain S-box-containing protein